MRTLRWYLTTCLATLIILPGAAYCATVNYTIEDSGDLIPQTAMVHGKVVQVKAAGGDPNKDILYHADRQILLVIDHRQRNYMQIDNKTIDEVAVLVESVSGVVESQQGVLSDLLGTLGVSGEKKKIAKMSKTSQQLNINGYSCQLYQAHMDKQLESEICVAENSALKMSSEDFDTMRGFLDFGNRMLLRAGKLLTALGLTLPEMNLGGTSGLPIGMHSVKDKLKVRVTGVDKTAGAAIPFGFPAGYSRASIPFTSG